MKDGDGQVQVQVLGGELRLDRKLRRVHQQSCWRIGRSRRSRMRFVLVSDVEKDELETLGQPLQNGA